MKSTTSKMPPLVRLGAIAELTLGFTPARKETQNSDTIRMVQVGDLQGSTHEVRSLTDLKPITVASGLAIDRYRVREGDILVSCKGTIGKLGLVGTATSGAVATSNLIIVRSLGATRPTTLLAILKSQRAKQFFQSHARGAAIQSLSFRDLEAMEVPRPDPIVEDRIQDLLETHSESVKATQRALEVREELTQGLLEQAIWG